MCRIADLIRENSNFIETQAVQMLLVVTKNLEEENKALKKQLKSSKHRKTVKEIFQIMHEELGTELTIQVIQTFALTTLLDQSGGIGLPHFMLLSGLTKSFSEKGISFSKEDGERLKNFMERLMNTDPRTRLLYQTMKKLNII